jgi:predicted lactoylglutathione lyase
MVMGGPISTKIFVNLPVRDLKRSVNFFSKLGFGFNTQFTDENATCMIIADDIFVMLLVEPFFKTFTRKEICNANKQTEVILCLSAESREAVDKMVNDAVIAGGTTPNDIQDQGWMYGRGFQDLDGHLWEIMFMDRGRINKS